MRLLFLLFLLLNMAGLPAAWAQKQAYYLRENNKLPACIFPDRVVAICLYEEQQPQLLHIADSLGLLLETSFVYCSGKYSDRVLTDTFIFRKKSGAAFSANKSAELAALRRVKHLMAGPLMTEHDPDCRMPHGGALVRVLENRLELRTKTNVTLEEVKAALAKYNLSIWYSDPLSYGSFNVVCNAAPEVGTDIVALAEKLRKDPMFLSVTNSIGALVCPTN